MGAALSIQSKPQSLHIGFGSPSVTLISVLNRGSGCRVNEIGTVKFMKQGMDMKWGQELIVKDNLNIME